MSYAINVESDCIRADLAGRQTTEQTKDLLRAIAVFGVTHTSFLIRVSHSASLLPADPQGLIEYLITAGCGPSHRFALVADDQYVQASHDRLERVARGHSLNLRSFRTEGEARQWLREGSGMAQA
ncbi:MAG TPA: hypothetical protein VE046_01395 [Steroidobacteraceae bacterium]|nr:hypothetical protein [Steroidobacteraceae bacterium]